MTDPENELTHATPDDETIEVRHVLIVANPETGGFSESTLAKIEAEFVRNVLHFETRRSARKGDIRQTVAAIGGAFDVVAVHGGDGSINEAVAGLRQIAGRRPALALIAGGTANVLALETGTGLASSQIAKDIMDGRTSPLHYGLANGQPFVLMASAGFDAAIVHRIPRCLKAALGEWAYIAAAIAQKRRARTPDLLVTIAGRTIVCRIAICANASRYGGDFIIAPETHATRPGLQLVLVKDDSLLGLLRIGWRLLAGRSLEGAGVQTLGADEIEIAAVAPAPVQLDGDPFGTTPLHATIAPAPLRLIKAKR
jgi:YegS/Rv2252/BmrU family lipid kinase